jgi:hypothetical protein
MNEDKEKVEMDYKQKLANIESLLKKEIFHLSMLTIHFVSVTALFLIASHDLGMLFFDLIKSCPSPQQELHIVTGTSEIG